MLLLSLLTALVMTAWDLTLDPFMVQKAKAWVWDQGGPYLGIPLANYVSWMETSFIIAVACRLVDRELAADWIIEQTIAFNQPAPFADDVTLVVLDRRGVSPQ